MALGIVNWADKIGSTTRSWAVKLLSDVSWFRTVGPDAAIGPVLWLPLALCSLDSSNGLGKVLQLDFQMEHIP